MAMIKGARDVLVVGVGLALMLTACSTTESDDGGTPSEATDGPTSAAEETSLPDDAPDAETVTIGQIAHLTGFGAEAFGIPVDCGLNLALDQIASSGYLDDVGVALDIRTEDDGTEPARAVTLFNGFASDGLEIVINSSVTPVAQAVAPVANDEEILFISVGSGGTGQDDDDYFFRMNDAINPVNAFTEYLVSEVGVERPVAIVDGDNPAFPAIADLTESGLRDAGLEDGFLTRQTISTDDTDFASVLTNLAQQEPDLIFFSAVPAQSGNVIRQMTDAGGFEEVLPAGTIGWGLQLVEIAGDAADGAVFPQAWAPNDADQGFIDAYQEACEDMPNAYSALGHDTGWLLATAIKQLKEQEQEITGTTLRDQLPAASEDAAFQEQALTAELALDASGRPSYPGVVATFTADGQIEVVHTP